MRGSRALVSCLAVWSSTIVLLVARHAFAQEQFTENPLPFTFGPYICNSFMQLDFISAANLHTGIDIRTRELYPDADQRVVAPIRYGGNCSVLSKGPDWIRLQADEQQVDFKAVFEAWHIIPSPTLQVGSPVAWGEVIGTVKPDDADLRWSHLHAALFLRLPSTICCDDRDLNDPQSNAFFLARGWNEDTFTPTLSAVVEHEVANTTVLQIYAYDRTNMRPYCLNGLHAISLYLDDVLVDELRFDRWRSKNGSQTPQKSEFYYCTTQDCTPNTPWNNPNVLEYKLSYATQPGNHMRRLKLEDAMGNMFFSQPEYGIPERHMPVVDLAGHVEGERVRLEWTMTAADLDEAGVISFSVWQSAGNPGAFLQVTEKPIPAVKGQEKYACSADAPTGPDSVLFRLTAANTIGSTLVLGETRVFVPQKAEGIYGYPNPTAEQFAIEVSLNREDFGEVAIFDVNGRRVRLLYRGALGGGLTRFAWNGRDDNGHLLGNGIYLLTVSAAALRDVPPRKIALYR